MQEGNGNNLRHFLLKGTRRKTHHFLVLDFLVFHPVWQQLLLQLRSAKVIHVQLHLILNILQQYVYTHHKVTFETHYDVSTIWEVFPAVSLERSTKHVPLFEIRILFKDMLYAPFTQTVLVLSPLA